MCIYIKKMHPLFFPTQNQKEEKKYNGKKDIFISFIFLFK